MKRGRNNYDTPIRSIKTVESGPPPPETYTEMHELIYSFNETLDHIDKMLNGGRPSEMPQNDSFLSLFPMQEVKDIVSIDSRIENCSEFQQNFLSFIVSFNCKTLKDFIKPILDRLFTNNLATNCTWMGYKGKFELKNLKMLKIMNDVSHTSFKGHTDALFQIAVKEWFKHAKQRSIRELNSKSQAITSE